MIAPAINRPGMMTDLLAGSAGWGDASILVPWALYRRTGNKQILEENYSMMQRWLAYLFGRTKAGTLKKLLKKNPWKQYLICSGLDYGEWCEPGIDNIRQMMKGNHDVATAYLSHSAGILARIAQILGHPEDAAGYLQICEGAKNAYCAEYTREGKIEDTRQCRYVRPLQMDLLPEEARPQAAADLARLVESNGFRLNTGFLSTPYLCQVLVEYGFVEEAQNVLLQEECPGWLYAVKKGATTVWENWDGIDESNHVKASLNHYSYGAIAGWLIRSVCGIRQEGQCVTFKPVVLPKLGYAKAEYLSPVGRIESSWEYRDDGLVTYQFTVPPNTRSVFETEGKTLPLEPGNHRLTLPLARTKNCAQGYTP